MNPSSRDFAPEALFVRQIEKRIGSFRLHADFTLAPGERAAIVGGSGTGKTSLLRILAGLESPDSGQVQVGQQELTRTPPERRRFAMVFQEQALFPALDVLQNVVFGLRMQGMPSGEREAQGLEWLGRVGLRDRARDSVAVLSGGERQRVAFVRALVTRPRVLLLDEPFSALDTNLRDQLRAQLSELLSLWPAPTVLVSHDEADLQALASRRISVRIAAGKDGVQERRFTAESL